MDRILKTTTLTLVAALVVSASTAFGATLFVPGEYPTLQSAIDAAVAGDMILVAPGTYFENIDYTGKDLWIQAEVGGGATVIDGGRAGPVVTFSGGESDQAILFGFSIVNGDSGSGGGILCQGASPIISDCRVMGNTAGLGGGVLFSSSYATIMNCTIADNVAGGAGGGGIACTGSGDALIINCDILGNSAGGSGGAVLSDLSMPWIMNSRIEDNQTSGDGGGIGMVNGSNLMVLGCVVSGNSASSYGGGIDHLESSSMIANCTITGNSASGGGGISFYASSNLNVLNCTFSGNSAGQGGGLLCSASTLLIQNCILWGDSAPSGPELAVLAGANLTIGYSDLQHGETAVTVDPAGSLSWWPGNIDQNPLFVGGGDYHLRGSSPCIDAGTNAGVYNDIDGENRPMGDGFDMGSDECRLSPEEFSEISFQATALQTSVYLRWSDPVDSGYPNSTVYIRRSPDDIPVDPFDGMEVYSGTDLEYEDTGLVQDQPYYYTIWVNDGSPYAVPPEGSTAWAMAVPDPGRLKICLRNGANELNFWFLSDDGPKKAGVHASDTALSPEWDVSAVGDIDRDGIDDIVFHNRRRGKVNLWLLDPDGVQKDAGHVIEEQMDSSWFVAGSGDIDGDGTVDLIWRNEEAERVDYWLLNPDGTMRAEGPVAETVVPARWRIECTGDIDGDGIMDLLFRNRETFKLNYWLLNADGTQKYGGTMMDSGPSDPWFIAGMGDIDQDGTDDLIWRHEGRRTVNYWLLNPDGTKRTGGRVTGEAVEASWAIADVGDIDQDGTIDLIWRNGTLGRLDYWFLNTNGTKRSDGPIDESPIPASWSVAGVGE